MEKSGRNDYYIQCVKMPLKIIGEITNTEIVAVGKSIREINRLNKVYGRARWQK